MTASHKMMLHRALLLSAVALGSVSGLGLYTFQYAEGLSYFSTDPNACANCHIMQPQLDSWQKSGHHHSATCVDCHLPHGFVEKYIAKAENGYHHSKGFTFQDFHEPIQIKQKNAEILQANCVRCHAEAVRELQPGDRRPQRELNCVHCHAMAGHGPQAGLGGRYTLTELEKATP